MLHIVVVIRKKIQLWQANCSPDMEYTVSKGVMASVQAFYFCFPSMLCRALSTSSFSCIFWLSHVGFPSDREQERTRKMATCSSAGSNLLLFLVILHFFLWFSEGPWIPPFELIITSLIPFVSLNYLAKRGSKKFQYVDWLLNLWWADNKNVQHTCILNHASFLQLPHNCWVVNPVCSLGLQMLWLSRLWTRGLQKLWNRRLDTWTKRGAINMGDSCTLWEALENSMSLPQDERAPGISTFQIYFVLVHQTCSWNIYSSSVNAWNRHMMAWQYHRPSAFLVHKLLAIFINFWS